MAHIDKGTGIKDSYFLSQPPTRLTRLKTQRLDDMENTTNLRMLIQEAFKASFRSYPDLRTVTRV